MCAECVRNVCAECVRNPGATTTFPFETCAESVRNVWNVCGIQGPPLLFLLRHVRQVCGNLVLVDPPKQENAFTCACDSYAVVPKGANIRSPQSSYVYNLGTAVTDELLLQPVPECLLS